MTRTTDYPDLEVRILDRQEGGYPVELTIDGRQFPRGFLDPGPLPWISTSSRTSDGERLYRWLLADPLLKEHWDRAMGLDSRCRIRLRIDASAPELHTVPWEMLRQPAGPGSLARDLAAGSTPFSRFPALPAAPGRQIIDDKLRVLVAIADPDDLAAYRLVAIDRAVEFGALEDALAGLPVELTLLPGPCTLPAIEAALRRGYHALHFVGHGSYTEKHGAALFLAGKDNRAEPTYARELADMLGRLAGPDNPLQLVFLGSCQTAQASPADAFRGLAPQLLQAGIPAVVAMQDLVPVVTARAFAQTFYLQLLQHGVVDLAANQARASLMTARLPGAAVPVLFMRVPDGKLLAIPGVDETAPAPGKSPYKGLQYFDVGDADDFFGREDLTSELVDYLRHNSLLAVVGASGSGKSSLVRAGLVNALQTGQQLADGTTPPAGSTGWPMHIITPTSRPLESLAASLTRESESVRATATLVDDLATDPRSLHFFVRRLLSKPGTGERLLLVVDQFEELFTLCKDRVQRKVFVDNLLAAACPDMAAGCSPADTSTLVVLTLRADFYAQCAEFDNLRSALERHQRFIGAMSTDELRQAIEKPASHGGWELEPGLVSVLLQDVGDEPGALPLLSHALLETWKRRQGRALTLAGYAASGRVQGAIAKTADEVYNKRLTAEQQDVARRIFLELTELGEGAQDTRRRVRLQDLIPQGEAALSVEKVLKLLTDARLVTTYQDEAEVAHEALIREWPALREWLEADREDLRVGRRLEEAAREWQREEEDVEALYRGARLVQALEWAAGHSVTLSPATRRFLDTSRDAADQAERAQEAIRQRELAQAQKLVEAERLRAEEQARFLRQVEDALAKAERQTRRAQAGELSSHAQFAAVNNASDPSQALLLARQAIQVTWSVDGYVVSNAVRAALDVAQTAPPWRFTLPSKHHTDSVKSAAYSPDGAHIVTSGSDKTAHVWEVHSRQKLRSLRGHMAPVNSATYSPDGTYIITSSDDRTACIWHAQTGKRLLSLRGHAASVNSATYSPDGNFIITASDDRTARVWNANSGNEILSLQGHTATVSSAAYSPNGKYVVTSSIDGTAQVWDAISGQALVILRGHADWVLSAAYNPDGDNIVTASDDQTARVWDAGSGRKILSLRGHKAAVLSATYSPDGAYIVTSSSDRTARVWDAHSGNELLSLRGHSASISSATFSPDGAYVITGSYDRTARVWAATATQVMFALYGHTDHVSSASYSPDGIHILTASHDRTVRIWDAVSLQEQGVLRGHTDRVSSAAYCPDGLHILTTSDDGTARIWHARDGVELLSLGSPSDRINSAVYSPVGDCILTVGADHIAWIWDSRSGKKILPLINRMVQIWTASFSPDGGRAVTTSERTARVWDVRSGKELLSLQSQTDGIWWAVYSPDGTQIITGSDVGIAEVWDAHTGDALLSLIGHTNRLNSAAYSPDGFQIVTASADETARVWDTRSGKEQLCLNGHTSVVWSVAYSPDGTNLVTTSGDQTARVWNAQNGKELLSLNDHTGAVRSVAYSPDGTHVVTTCDDNITRVWPATADSLLAVVERLIQRDPPLLTPDERRRFGLE